MRPDPTGTADDVEDPLAEFAQREPLSCKCPKCGSECGRDEADVGVGVIYGPWGCSCGWSEYEEYDLSDGRDGLDERGGFTDQYGVYYPPGNLRAKLEVAAKAETQAQRPTEFD